MESHAGIQGHSVAVMGKVERRNEALVGAFDWVDLNAGGSPGCDLGVKLQERAR
jgi:hypothetical protein